MWAGLETPPPIGSGGLDGDKVVEPENQQSANATIIGQDRRDGQERKQTGADVRANAYDQNREGEEQSPGGGKKARARDRGTSSANRTSHSRHDATMRNHEGSVEERRSLSRVDPAPTIDGKPNHATNQTPARPELWKRGERAPLSAAGAAAPAAVA